MKFQKLFDNILKEEIDFDKYISKFENGYNKIFNLYKTIRGSNGKTVGYCFRQLGAKTTKSSTETK